MAFLQSIPWWGWLIIAVVLTILLTILGAVVKQWGKVLLTIFTVMGYIVSAPFIVLSALINLIQKKRENTNSGVKNEVKKDAKQATKWQAKDTKKI